MKVCLHIVHFSLAVIAIKCGNSTVHPGNVLHSRPLSNLNEAVYCLSVPERGVSEAWKLDLLKKKYQIAYLVKVVKLE